MTISDALDYEDPSDGDIEEEQVETGKDPLEPWDPKKIRITTKNLTLREVVDQIVDNEIDLAPDFQREYVWKERQKTRLIESILLGIPLPAFYFNQDPDGTYQVVDGVQRLTTVRLFMEGQHVLDANDLEYLGDLAGKRYSNLDPATVRRFRSTQIVVHIIEPQTPEDVKYDIFGRVNTLGSPLSAQEIRHAMSKQRSRHFLEALTELEAFHLATGDSFRKRVDGQWKPNSRRMANRELALRFCALHQYTAEDYRKHGSLDAYLVDFTKRLDGRASDPSLNISDAHMALLKTDFERAMSNAYNVLGRAAFRRWSPSGGRRGPINRAVFESQALALANYALEHLVPYKDPIASAFQSLFNDDAYLRSVTVGTGDPAAITERLTRTREALEEVLR